MEIKYFDFFTFLFRNNFIFVEKLHYIFIVICDIIHLRNFCVTPRLPAQFIIFIALKKAHWLTK